MVTGVKYGLIGGFVAAILLWGRAGEAFPIVYLICLLAGALAGREIGHRRGILAGATAGLVSSLLFNIAYFVWAPIALITKLGYYTGETMTPGFLLGQVLQYMPSNMLSPYTVGRVVIGTIAGAMGGLIGAALVRGLKPPAASTVPDNDSRPPT